MWNMHGVLSVLLCILSAGLQRARMRTSQAHLCLCFFVSLTDLRRLEQPRATCTEFAAPAYPAEPLCSHTQAATKQNTFRAQELDTSTSSIKEALAAINDKLARLDQEDKRVGPART